MNIIELAKQAALKRHQEQAPGIDGVVANWIDLEAFANLIAEHEREECAKVCDDWPNGRDDVYLIGVAIRARGTT